MHTIKFCKVLARLNLIILFVCSVTSSVGQKIENLKLQQAGDKILIHFDFISDHTESGFQIRAYHSGDNFNQPINLARGDVGDNVLPGRNKQIEWFAREELGGFRGDIIIEIRVFLTPENLYVQNPTTSSKIKKGQALNINWSGGINEDKVSLFLLKDGQTIETIANNIDNTGTYSWISSDKLKPAKTYAIRIAGASTSGKQAASSNFTIARKVPMWLIIAPVAIVAAGAAVLLSSSDGGNGDENLPGAPDPN